MEGHIVYWHLRCYQLIIDHRISLVPTETTMARILALVLLLGVLFFVVTARSFAQTNSPKDDEHRPFQAAINTGVRHIIWVWFENRESTAITAATAPYFTSFANANVNMTNFYGVSHPSQPNYLDAFSGSNQGVTNDNHFTFPASVDNLAKQLAYAGKSWRVYAQNFPGACFDGDTFTGGIDGPGLPGLYVRKHNPAMSFQSVSLDPIQCANVQPLANFDPTVNFAMVVPNQTNDMHDGTTAQGDAFLQAFVPLVTNSTDWAHTLLIVTFDEGTTSINGGGHVYTAAAAPWLVHANVATTYNHFNVLRTIEEVYGLPFLGSAVTATTITELLPVPRAVYDFDGDGKTDISVFRPSSGNWYIMRSRDNAVTAQNFGLSTDSLAPADFDGDGKTDIAVFRSGAWYIMRSRDGFAAIQFGQAGDIAQPGDYDGDGIADVAVYRSSTGVWYLQRSRDGLAVIQFGSTTDRAVAADYDGDGRTDVAVYRDGIWYVLKSTAGFYAVQFGLSSDIPVMGDYSGDNKADVAVFRPSTGEWYVLRSENNSVYSIPFGTDGDVPAAGDYDGDGRFDTAVFRPSTSTWYMQRSASGLSIQGFGAPGDISVPGYMP